MVSLSPVLRGAFSLGFVFRGFSGLASVITFGRVPSRQASGLSHSCTPFQLTIQTWPGEGSARKKLAAGGMLPSVVWRSLYFSGSTFRAVEGTRIGQHTVLIGRSCYFLAHVLRIVQWLSRFTRWFRVFLWLLLPLFRVFLGRFWGSFAGFWGLFSRFWGSFGRFLWALLVLFCVDRDLVVLHLWRFRLRAGGRFLVVEVPCDMCSSMGCSVWL